jgi:hypothetical protein
MIYMPDRKKAGKPARRKFARVPANYQPVSELTN